MPRVALIVNPLATGVDEHRIALVEHALSKHADVDTHLTQRSGHGVELAREVAPHVEAIFVFSGDGGFNEVVNGLEADGPAVGAIPGGGTSVFPRGLGIPRDPLRATEQLATAFEEGRTRRITLGRVNGRRFLFNAGLLFDAELVRRIEAQRSRAGRPGGTAFVAQVLKLIAENGGRFDPAVEIDGEFSAAFVLVANASPYTYLGSMPLRIAPDARLELGLDYVAPARVRPYTVPALLQYVLTGHGLPRSARIAHDRDRIQVRCLRPLPLQADGEDLGDVEHVTLEAERGAVSVLV